MIDEPKIAQLDATPTAYIHLTIPRDKMPEVMGPAVEEVISTVAGQGVEATGAVFAHHLKMDPKTFDFEVGVPVSAPVAPSGRVEPGKRPVTRVAQTVYHGPYDGLPGTWGKFHDWLENSGHKWAPDIWECYVVHPGSEPDPANWQTQLNRPLAD
ncbi:MAG: GyrI-like domain-containing protein [Woeseia sp.]